MHISEYLPYLTPSVTKKSMTSAPGTYVDTTTTLSGKSGDITLTNFDEKNRICLSCTYNLGRLCVS